MTGKDRQMGAAMFQRLDGSTKAMNRVEMLEGWLGSGQWGRQNYYGVPRYVLM